MIGMGGTKQQLELTQEIGNHETQSNRKKGFSYVISSEQDSVIA